MRYLSYFSYIIKSSPGKSYWNKITINRRVHVTTKMDTKNLRHALKLHISGMQKINTYLLLFHHLQLRYNHEVAELTASEKMLRSVPCVFYSQGLDTKLDGGK